MCGDSQGALCHTDAVRDRKLSQTQSGLKSHKERKRRARARTVQCRKETDVEGGYHKPCGRESKPGDFWARNRENHHRGSSSGVSNRRLEGKDSPREGSFCILQSTSLTPMKKKCYSQSRETYSGDDNDK